MEEYQLLEEEFAKWTQMDNMVVCSSGTAALHLAFEVLRSVEGYRTPQERHVAIPDTAMIACPRAVVAAGLAPRFVPVNFSGLIEQEFEAVVSAVLSVHLYGRKAPTDFTVPVIEDCAEAHGITPNPDSFAACWSFYRNKIVCGEEGGAVAFQKAEHAALARELRTLGMTTRHDFNHVARGMNYRLANLLAKPIRESLKQADENITKRRRVQAMYDSDIPKDMRLPKRSFPWVYDLDLPEEVDSWKVVQALVARGIPARQAFKPMSKQAEFCRLDESFKCTNATYIGQSRIYLPIAPGMRQRTVVEIVKTLKDVVGSRECLVG